MLENVTLDELLHRLLTAFQEFAPAVQAAAFYLSEADLLRLHASFGISDEDARGDTVKVDQGFPGRVAAEKRTLLVRVPSAEPGTRAPWSKMRVVQGLPLIVRGRLMGVAVMGSYSSWDFAKGDQVAFEVVAKQATVNIHDWKVREAIENQKARLDALLAQMPAGVILAEAPSGKMTLHNAQVEALWRRPFIACGSVEEYRAWPAYRRDGRRLESEEFPLARALRGAVVVNQEVEILRGDGSRGTILSNASPIRARDGRIVGAVTAFVDITEKRTTERQLREMAAQAQSAEAVQAIIAEASVQLAESFHEGTTLHSIVRLAVPRIADGCALFLTHDGQRPRLHEIAHVDARKAALMRTLLGETAPEKFGELVDRICRTQKPHIVPLVTEAVLREMSAREDDQGDASRAGARFGDDVPPGGAGTRPGGDRLCGDQLAEGFQPPGRRPRAGADQAQRVCDRKRASVPGCPARRAPARRGPGGRLSRFARPSQRRAPQRRCARQDRGGRRERTQARRSDPGRHLANGAAHPQPAGLRRDPFGAAVHRAVSG